MAKIITHYMRAAAGDKFGRKSAQYGFYFSFARALKREV